MKLSSRISQVVPSATLEISSRAKKMKAEGLGVIDFGAGEPDFDTPSFIKESAKKAIDENFTRYTPASGIAPLKEAISEGFKKYGLKYEPNQVVISCGAKHSIYNVIQVLCEKKDEVIIISPYWVSYLEMVRLAEAKPKILKTKLKNGFKLDMDKLNKIVTKHAKLLILNSPSNPAGVVYEKKELEKIAELCIEKDILVLSDEIYSEIIFDNSQHYSIGALSDEILQRTITVNGVSKTYAMTGWRIGYIGAPKEIADAVGKLQSHSTSNPTSISQKAALAAIKGDQPCVSEMVKAFQERRDFIAERLDSIKGIKYFKPQGAFYVFCGISSFKLDSNSFAKRLLEEEKVAVVPGESFGHDDFIRISFATSLENIRKGLDRIEKFTGKL